MTTNAAKTKKTQQEDANSYDDGGHHPVKIGDTYRNRYTVLRKLGCGQYSTVWLCWDEQNTQFVALKIVKSASFYKQSALRELQFLECAKRSQSDHPHKIVRLLDSFSIPGVNRRHICMVFETLGHNLKEIIRRSGKKGIPLTSVKSVLRQVLGALDFLHTTCNIIHTDIKPENICMDENEICKLASQKAGLDVSSQGKVTAGYEVPVTLADLGNACWVDGHTTEFIQTRPYRSPEVILGGEYGANADIWSTACMAFELATGHYLFPLISRNMNKRFSEDEYHLARITSVLGYVPKRIAFASVHSRGFFTEEGELRYAPDFPSCGLVEKLTGRFQWSAIEAHQFADFLLPMLAIDPNDRCSAKDCLGHKWLDL